MSTITSLSSGDNGATSMATINTNFDNLNTDKAELDSPTFTGTPSLPTGTTAVTQAPGDNSTKVATTAYVYTAIVGGNDVSCHVYQTGATTIGSSATLVEFGAERFDTDTMHDNSTNPSRITFTTAGKYLVGGTVRTTGSNVDAGIIIRLDGTTEIACTNAPSGNGSAGGASASVLYDFTAGQYIEILATIGQDGAGSTTGDGATNAWAIKMN
jgi:hypothetical protein